MFRIFLPILILLFASHIGAFAETWEEFQKLKAVEEESAPVPKSGPKLVPKDVVIEKLKTECQVSYGSDALLFHFGQSVLKPDFMPNLKSMAEALIQAATDPELSKIGRYYVDGHTCSIGGAEMNCRLSWARANAVIDHLVKLGVPKEKLVARGYGLTNPAHSNDSEDTRMLNRRVVLKGDCKEGSSGQDPTPCSLSEKGSPKAQKRSQDERVSPSLEEVAGVKGGSKTRKSDGNVAPGSSGKGNDQQSLPRGFKRID
jgi:outer membrane protein OmpA-like peptidoglycan-associated protein